MASIRCAHCKNTHNSVQEVRECAQGVVSRARWDLYWKAHEDIWGEDDHPDDEHTPERQEDFQNWLTKVLSNPDFFIAPGATDADRRKAHLAVKPGTLQSRMEEMRREIEGPLFCGHIDKAGDLCAESLELTADNEPTHEDRLINLEHNPLAVSHGQLDRLRAGEFVNGAQLQKTQERRQQRMEPVAEGWYKVGETIYKVQRAVHGSGNLYAKELVVEPLAKEEFTPAQFAWLEREPEKLFHQARWEYVPGAIRQIRGEHKLSIEECLQFGKLYGVCVRCARTLTKEESIARGMGDVCAGKGLI